MINEGCVFIGGYAASLYGRYMTKNEKKQLEDVPDFDVLSMDPKEVAYILKEKLQNNGFKYIDVIKNQSVGDDIILTHYEISVNGDTICYIYEPYGCYSYNEITLNNNKVKVATIETMLLFILAFIYSDRPYYDHERLMCMAQYLINVQNKNRLEQKGLLKRFNTNCYGNEKKLIEIRSSKAEKYEELKYKKNTPEYNKYFLKYIPKITAKKRKHYNKKTKRMNKRKDDDNEYDDNEYRKNIIKPHKNENQNIVRNIFKSIF